MKLMALIYNHRCPKGSFASLEIVAEFAIEYEAHFEMVKLVAFTRVLLHSLTRFDLSAIDCAWSMNIRDVIIINDGWSAYDRRQASSAEPSVFKLYGRTVRLFGIEDLSIDERSVLSSSVLSIDQILTLKLSEKQLKQGATDWANYEQLSVLCKSLIAMGMWPSTNHYAYAAVAPEEADTDDASCAVIKAARKALLNKDAQDLVRLLHGVKDSWAEFLSPLNAVASCHVNEVMCDDLMKKLPSVRKGNVEHTRPEILPQPKLDSAQAEVEDFVYEKYRVNGKVVYRLITPAVVGSKKTAKV